jgi:hypothetical protein
MALGALLLAVGIGPLAADDRAGAAVAGPPIAQRGEEEALSVGDAAEVRGPGATACAHGRHLP